MSKAFVIHIHSGYGPLHFDLMLEHGPALATWQLAASPESMAAGGEIPARPLPHHRRAYLTCEGPVSGDRGSVRVLDRGEFQLLSAGEDRWEFVLAGSAVRGRFELIRQSPPDAPGDDWLLRRLD